MPPVSGRTPRRGGARLVGMAAERVSAGHRSCSAGLASDPAGAVGRGFETGGGADQRIGLRLELVRGRPSGRRRWRRRARALRRRLRARRRSGQTPRRGWARRIAPPAPVPRGARRVRDTGPPRQCLVSRRRCPSHASASGSPWWPGTRSVVAGLARSPGVLLARPGRARPFPRGCGDRGASVVARASCSCSPTVSAVCAPSSSRSSVTARAATPCHSSAHPRARGLEGHRGRKLTCGILALPRCPLGCGSTLSRGAPYPRLALRGRQFPAQGARPAQTSRASGLAGRRARRPLLV